ncbi:MAG: hypothetical protein AAF388_18635 [Bacteroidota bacterium]
MKPNGAAALATEGFEGRINPPLHWAASFINVNLPGTTPMPSLRLLQEGLSSYSIFPKPR